MKFRPFSNVHWSDKLVDVLVVVLGITIAFGLNHWQSARKNKAYEYQLGNLMDYIDNYDLRREKVFSRNAYNNHIFDAHLIRYRKNLRNRQKWINEALENHRILQQLIREELYE